MYEDILVEMRRIELNPQEGDEKLANPSLSEKMRYSPIYNREELSLVPDDVKEKLCALKYDYWGLPSGLDWYEIHGPYEAKGRWFGLAKKKILLERVMDDVHDLLEHDITSRGDRVRSAIWFGTIAELWQDSVYDEDSMNTAEILSRDLLPFLATYSMFRIRPRDLIACLTRITDRGDYARARKAIKIIRDVYFYAGITYRVKCPLPEDYVIITADPESEEYKKAREKARISLFNNPLPEKDYVRITVPNGPREKETYQPARP